MKVALCIAICHGSEPLILLCGGVIPNRGVLGVFSTARRLILLALKAAFWRSLEPAYNTMYAAHPLKNTLYDEYPLKTELYAILRLRGGKSFFYWCLR